MVKWHWDTWVFLAVLALLVAPVLWSTFGGADERLRVQGRTLADALPPTIVIFVQSELACANDEPPPSQSVQPPHFVLGVGTLRVAATRSKIVADDRVHSLKALLKGTGWSRHLRVRPAAGHSGVRYAVDVTQVEADAGTVFCHWLSQTQAWHPGPYPCEMAY